MDVSDEDISESESIRRQFEAARERFAERADQIYESIVALGDKIDRRFSEISEKMDRGFAETWALLRSSSAEPDHEDH
jgi:hypothetical protein